MPPEKATSEGVRVLIESELALGASSQEIESFFNRHSLPFGFDRYANRYYGIIRDVSPDPGVDQAIVIYLNVDELKRFKSAEVRDSFTAP